MVGAKLPDWPLPAPRARRLLVAYVERGGKVCRLDFPRTALNH